MSSHLVSLIKHHGLFAHTLLSFLHPIQRFFELVNLGLPLHTRHRIQGYFFLIHVTRPNNGSFIWYRVKTKYAGPTLPTSYLHNKHGC